jgi:signal transduction histidine kinase
MRKKLHEFRSFRTQLTLTITMIVLGTIVIISLLANIFINLEYAKRAKEQQQTHASDLAVILSHQYDSFTGEWGSEYIHGVGMTALYDGYIIRLTDSRGNVVWDAENHDMEACSQVMMNIIERMEQKRPGLNGSFVAQEYDLKQNSQTVGSVVIQYYGPYFLSESDFNFLDSLNLVLLVIVGLALFFSVVAAGFLAKRISRPIIKTAQIATQIADGNYKTRFAGGTRTQELDELVTAVNHMAISLDRQEALRKRLTGDIAHELRTPLSAVSSHLEAMIEGVWQLSVERLQSCYEEIGRISGLVSDLEKLEEMERINQQLEKAPLDLLELAHAVAGNFESEAAKKGIAIAVDGEPANVTADKDRLTQVMTNLLSNAIKYTPENGNVRLSVNDSEAAGIFVIEDNGIGIPETDLPLIFERFYRTDISRNRKTGGVGIGLAIAKSIVNAYGGTIQAESNDGQGSRFIVILPKAIKM